MTRNILILGASYGALLATKLLMAGLPCLSIMNMLPLPYLKRIPALAKRD